MGNCLLGGCVARADDGNHSNSLHHYSEIPGPSTSAKEQDQAQPMRQRASDKLVDEHI